MGPVPEIRREKVFLQPGMSTAEVKIDYTFYRLRLEKDGKHTQNFHVLKKYREMGALYFYS